MNDSSLVITVSGVMISILIGIVGYLLNRQLQSLDDKVDLLDNNFFKMKVDIIEINKKEKIQLMDHVNEKPVSTAARTQIDQLAGIRADVTILKDYQRNKISPALEGVLIMNKKVEEQTKNQQNSDEIVAKMFALVKALVEKNKKE